MPLRLDRYGSILRKEISDIIFRRMRDQDLGLVSITSIEITKDVSRAVVHVSVLAPDKKRGEVVKTLNGASKFIKGEIGRVIRNVTIPDLVFMLDVSLERGVQMSHRIDEIIRQDNDGR
ncbi:30S ribosome-binding factor RbfA [bacterium]|nr:30S ribosome-binding factor RbfA [bacterium]